MPSIFRASEIARIVRFGSVGLMSAALYYGIFLLINMWTGPMAASVIAYVLSASLNYYFQSTFSFRQSAVNRGNAVRFVIMHVFCAALNTSLLWLLTEILDFPLLRTQAAIVVLISALSYIISRFWVFAPRQQLSRGQL